MAKTQRKIAAKKKDFSLLHQKLSGFIDQLPEDEADLMAVILARASAAKKANHQEIKEHLLAGTGIPSTPPTLAQLAKSLDGASSLDDAGWVYNVWAYAF